MVFSAKKGVLLVLWFCLVLAEVKGVERGKVDIRQAANGDFHCEYVSFSSSFSSGTPVRVFASLNHGNESSGVHDTAFIWVEDVTTSGFKACLVQGGQGYGGNTTIDWFALQGSQSGVYHGEASLSLFTTGTKCSQVAFPQNWMAYEQYPSSWQAKESSEVAFYDNEVPTAENNYSLCKIVNFTSPFYKPPVVIKTVLDGGSNNANIACPVKGPLSSWIEEVTNNHFRVCIKDDAGYDGQRGNVTVDYLVIGDLDPCTNSSCKYHSHCVALSSHQFTCVCESTCPSYEEQVCASNGRTFKNLCLLKQEICRTRGNYTHYHPGSCTGFPLQKGRHKLQNTPSWAEDQCEVIKLEPFLFYPHKKIYIQLTVNHINYSDSNFVHEATTPWVESVNSTQFTACVTRAGRNDYPTDSFATVDWIAHQGSPSGGVAGEEMFSRWWTGTSCQTVTFPNGHFTDSPTVFATAEHHRSSLKHDATSVWLEDVSSSSFKICLRELQNFAGVHDDISVNWLAFDSLHRPLFKENNDINFLNNVLPSKKHNFAFCQDVSFLRRYSNTPTVLLTAKHSTSGGNAAAECNGIVTWIEFISNSGFRVCAKELFVQHFDPLTVSYAVLADICGDDWTYFKGYCYRQVSSCDSWSGSRGTCATFGANLPSIHSQEENVYVQSLHGGEHSWLGLSDINTEGTFVWSDGTPFDFHYWAKHQPNNFHNEDCVHTLGFLQGHKYEWNDVNCTDCHRFTCKKDYNECGDFSYDCPVNATCVNSDGSYSCQCPVGYRLGGNNCTDVDECSVPVCDVNANCQNTPGSFVCSCKVGFSGDGKTCTDVDECSASISVCDVNANCQNTVGSYNCSCKAGFTGDGKTCTAAHKDCATLYKSGKRSSGVYTINPDGSGTFDVFCDQTTAGGGWTVFQKRQDGSVDFYRGWADYKGGFGNLNGEYWLGLEKIHRLTSSGQYNLRVDLEDFAGNTVYAEYGSFGVASEGNKYQLSVGSYSGTAGDSLTFHNSYPFSTKDQDNDYQSNSNCAVQYKGAWWYHGCYNSNLNGPYRHGKYTGTDSVTWYYWKRNYESAKRAEMKIRPAFF
ncbi:hypothetical protein ACROYT_G030116 [Oculina patagonica]